MLRMSKDERKFGSFAEISSDEEENMSILERLLRAPAKRNVQNQLARGIVGDGSNEPSSDLCRHASGPRNPICTNMGAEGGQNAVRSSENVQQSAGYSLLQPTSNNRNISNTIDSASGCRVWNKKMRTCEMNPNEDSCQCLDLSIRGASYKTDVISGGENCSCQKTQSNTSTSSAECSSSALSSTRNSGDQGRKHVCDVCRNELSNLSSLKLHKRAHYGEKHFVCDTCPNRFARNWHLVDHQRTHTGERPYICEICQMTFQQSSHLKGHEAIHSRTKPHHCDYCDFENAHKRTLDKHLETYHSEHKEKCPVCGDYFYSKKSLQSHKCKKPQ